MDMQSQMRSAARHLKKELGNLPPQLIRYAKGIVFLTLFKGAFLWSGSISTGIIVKKLANGEWSPPVSVGMASIGFGLQAGGQKVDIIIIVGDDEEINTFAGTGQLKLGVEYGLAAGPVGRDMDLSAYIGKRGLTCSMYYSRSKGLFAGFSLEGALLISRWTTNNSFYEQKVKVKDVLDGKVKIPAYKQAAVDELHQLVHDYELGKLEATIGLASSSLDPIRTPTTTVAVPGALSREEEAEEEQNEQELLLHFSTLGETGKSLLKSTLEQGGKKVTFIADHAVNESDPLVKAYGIIGGLTGDGAVILEGDLQTGLGGALSDYIRVRVNHAGYEREGLVSRYVLQETT